MPNETVNVKVFSEVKVPQGLPGWHLCLQWCGWEFRPQRQRDYGYRFIYRDNTGRIRPQRGQASICDLAIMTQLMNMATAAGWGNLSGYSESF